MSNEQSYRPRSPNLSGLTEPPPPPLHSHQQQPPPRLTRLPSYQIQEPNLPRGFSFSPRGSYDASPFFNQPLQASPGSDFSSQQTNAYQPQPQPQPQSPPRYTPASLPDQPQVFSPVSYSESPQRNRTTGTFHAPHHQSPQQQSFTPYQQQSDDMARLRSRKPMNYNEDQNGAQYDESVQMYPPIQHMSQPPIQPQHQFMQQPMSFGTQPPPVPMQQPIQQFTPSLPPIDVKTKFPVARIKRIMQADEDVGKVAQATPTAVSKALELFMIALVTKGAVEAKANSSKRVTATHLKHALLTDPQFDFLNEICEAVPDEGAKGSKGRAKSEAKSEDSDEDMVGAPKKKGKAGKKKKSTDGDGDASD